MMFNPLLFLAAREVANSGGGAWDAITELARIARHADPLSWLKLAVICAAVIWGLPWLIRRGFDHRIRRMGGEDIRSARRNRRRARTRRRQLGIIVATAAFVLSLALAGWIFHSAALLFMLAVLSYMALIGTGLNLIVWGWRSRVGTRIVCAKCDYAMGSWRAAADRCPECGNAWKEPWRARIGERRVRGRVIAMGALVLVVSTASVVVLMSLALRR